MSLLFNMLSRLVITFLPRSTRLLISWLQSPSAVILEPKKIKSATVSTVSPSISHEVMGLDAMIFVFWMLSFTLIQQQPKNLNASKLEWWDGTFRRLPNVLSLLPLKVLLPRVPLHKCSILNTQPALCSHLHTPYTHKHDISRSFHFYTVCDFHVFSGFFGSLIKSHIHFWLIIH